MKNNLSTYENLSREDILKILKSRDRELYKFKTLFDHLAEGVYMTDCNTKTLYVNIAYEKLSGSSREHFIGKTMYQVLDEKLIDESGTLLAIKNRKSISIQQKLANNKIALITSTPIINDKDELEYVVTIVRDITEIMNLREKIIEREREIQKLKSQKERTMNFFMYKSHETEIILEQSKKVAKYDSTILITGETGTGKGTMAEYIHKNSNRSDKKFIQLNCASIPASLIESELFGYEKGAFTGARDSGKIGIFEQAHGGTLFLDEIGELPLSMQSKLLTVLQDKKIRKIGSDSEIDIDVRIITATNRDLNSMIEAGKFREDLYYRINVVPIHIPPLRDRREDITALTKEFLREINEKYNIDVDIDSEAFHIMYYYDWPGNVRELKNLIERLFVFAKNNTITKEDLPQSMLINISNKHRSKDIIPLNEAISKLESELIVKAFEKKGNVRDAAKLLEIHPSTFVRKRQKYIEDGFIK